MRAPMNEKTRTLARELFNDGHSRNGIARKLDLDPATITRWANAEGLKFDRSQTDMATRAHTVDLAAERIELAQLMMTAARDGLMELDKPFTVYSFGGRDNTYAEHVFASPPPDIRRQALTSAAIAFDKATKATEGSDPGQAAAVSLLAGLAQMIGVSGPDA